MSRQLGATLLGLAFVVAACSSSDDAETIGAGADGSAETPATETTAGVEDPVDESADATIVNDGEATLLASVIGVEASGEGWALAPGDWTSPKLGTPITFSTTEPLALVDNAQGAIGLADPGFTFEEFNSFLIANFVGVLGPEQEVQEQNVRDLPDDLSSYLEDSGHILVTDTGTMEVAGDSASWWEIAADPTRSDGFECQYGSHCTNVLMHGAFGPFQIGDGVSYRFRVAELPQGPGDQRILFWLQATSEEFDGLWAKAEVVLTTLEFEGPETEEGAYDLAGGAPFAQIEPGPLKTGTYTTNLGGAHVELEVLQDQDDLVFEFAGPSFFVVSWVPVGMQEEEAPEGQSPAVVVTELIGFVTPEVSATEATGPPPPENIIAKGTDLTGHFEATPGLTLHDSGSAVIGGHDATWWEIGRSEDVSDAATFDCAGRFGPPGERCVEVAGGTGLGFVMFGGDIMRVYEIDGVDFYVMIEADEPDHAAAFEALMPILDGLTITP